MSVQEFRPKPWNLDEEGAMKMSTHPPDLFKASYFHLLDWMLQQGERPTHWCLAIPSTFHLSLPLASLLPCPPPPTWSSHKHNANLIFIHLARIEPVSTFAGDVEIESSKVAHCCAIFLGHWVLKYFNIREIIWLGNQLVAKVAAPTHPCLAYRPFAYLALSSLSSQRPLARHKKSFHPVYQALNSDHSRLNGKLAERWQ